MYEQELMELAAQAEKLIESIQSVHNLAVNGASAYATVILLQKAERQVQETIATFKAAALAEKDAAEI